MRKVIKEKWVDMRNVYRTPPEKEEPKMRYIYEIFSKIWNWLDWDNFFNLCLGISCIGSFILIVILFLCYLFVPHTVGGCYVDSGGNQQSTIFQSVNWEPDNNVTSCVFNDIDCINRAFESKACKP